jgi:hypothetical protein
MLTHDLTDDYQYVEVTGAIASNIAVDSSYDSSKAIAISIQVGGLDAQGNQVNETISLDDSSCFEPLYFRDDKNTYVFTKNAFTTLSGWTITSSSNAGSSQVVAMGQALSKIGSKCALAKVSIRKTFIDSRDCRSLKPATINDNAIHQSSGFIGSLGLRRLV